MARQRLIDDEALERPFNAQQFFRLLRYMKPYRKQFALSIALMIIAALCGLAGPTLIRYALDIGIAQGRRDVLIAMVAAMIACGAIGGVCLFYRIRLMEFSGRGAIAKLREDLFDHIQGLSFSFFDNRPAGKIMVRVINDINSLNNLFVNGVVNTLIDCLTLVLIVIIMLWTDVRLTLIGLGLLPVMMLFIFKMKRVMRKNWQAVRRKTSSMNAYLHESLAGMRTTQSFVRENENQRIFGQTNEDIRFTWMRAIRINLSFWPALDIIGTMGTVLVYWIGVTVLHAGGADSALSVGTLLSIIWYLMRFWQPINSLSNVYNQVLVAAASMERVFEILDTPPDIHNADDARIMPAIQGDVSFDNVTFSYDPEKIVLKDVSFDVRQGQTIALVGPTGAGKTTIVNLISRFYDPTDGRVLIDGRDIKHADMESFRKQMGIMMQDSFIFSGTIMDNIRYGRLSATDEEVIEAAKAVGAHEFIENMEKKYMTEVNERGSRLSVGQKQLISFARALLADPRILILDEATSSIDTRTEMVIQRALERLLKGRTSFVIAHRLSTIRKADRIMVIADHGIAESGSHDELMALEGGHYRALCMAQYRFLNAG